MATHLRNGLFGLEVGTGHSYICLFGRKPKKLSLKELHRSAAWAVLPSEVGFLLGMAVTHQSPLQIFLFDRDKLLKKLILFYFTHCLQKTTFLPPCVSDAALSVLIKNTCAHAFKPTGTHSHTWCMYSNHMHTLLQPKLCCPFILQVMTKINCELHSICTEFTVQMNSNEEYIGIQ